MTTKSELPATQTTIHKAIVSVMRELEAVGKGRKNQAQGYSFRGIDDVYNAVNPLMAKHGIFTVPEVLETKREERSTKNGGAMTATFLRMKYTFYAGDGSSIIAIVEGEGMDSGDKSTNKAMAVAHKYALVQVFAIPTEDTKDPEHDDPRPVARRTASPPEAAKPSGSAAPGTQSQPTEHRRLELVHAATPEPHEGNGHDIPMGKQQITFGIHRRKRLEEVSTADLEATVAWCVKNSKYLDQAQMIRKYLDTGGDLSSLDRTPKQRITARINQAKTLDELKQITQSISEAHGTELISMDEAIKLQNEIEKRQVLIGKPLKSSHN